MRRNLRTVVATVCMLLFTLLACPAIALAEEETGLPLSNGYVIEDGKVQSVYPYTPGTDTRSYSNDTSDIIRFAVWVETPADTDADGRLDLIKAIVQLPRAAMEGKYKAATIYEANPAAAGVTQGKGFMPEDLPRESDLFLGSLAKDGASHTPSATVSTIQAAAAADPSDWHYQTKTDRSMAPLRKFLSLISPLANPLLGGDAKSAFESALGMGLDEVWEYKNLTTYDNFLTQGYAVVLTGGLGTYGSEGLPCCGFGVEARAARSVVQWLHGDRVAFADPEGTQAIVADWSNGSVGMIGRGYAGALAFEVASQGVDGLRCVVPEDGIASWYDYANSQGEAYTNTYGALNMLSATLATGIVEGQRDETIANRFRYYLSRMNRDQEDLAGMYRFQRLEDEPENDEDLSPWEFVDFSHRTGNFRAAALIVHGLNDLVVRTKQFELMRAAFTTDGCDVKLLLHQNGFVSPADEEDHAEIMVGSETYDDLLNRWFAHYLLEVDNGIQDMAHATVQSNVDGSYYTYSTLATTNSITIAPAAGEEQAISSEGAPRLLSEQYSLLNGASTDFASAWSADVSQDVTIQGTPEVVLRVATNTVEPRDLAVSVVLSDEADTPFAAYELDKNGKLPVDIVEAGGANRGAADAYDIVRYRQTEVNKHLITMGSVNLRCPDSVFDPRTARPVVGGINAGEFLEYHVYLNPTNYTVQAGHHLRVYVLTYATADAKKLFGAESESEGRFGDYRLSIDPNGSYASIPCV